VKLYMFRKRAGCSSARKARAARFCFWSMDLSTSYRSFDLNVPGHGDYSVMDKFCGLRFRCLDDGFRGLRQIQQDRGQFGYCQRGGRLEGCRGSCRARDGARALSLFRRVLGALCGPARSRWSRPERINRMVLGAFTYTGQGSPRWPTAPSKLSFTEHILGGRAIAI